METREINNSLKHIKIFKGTFARDKIPEYVTVPAALVINTDFSSSPGSHSVAIFIQENGEGEYYDSFGVPPQYKEIIDFLGRNCFHRLSYNQHILQEMSPQSITCGKYCVLILDMRSRGISFCNLLRIFTANQSLNDKIIVDII